VTPRIRYCATQAGRVAYTTTGTGPPLLCDSGWITHLRAQLELLSYGTFIDQLAGHFTVIRYDKPGCGLSDRPAGSADPSPGASTDGIDLSFDAQVAAALAVADAVGADRFSQFGASQGAQVAAAIAARHPERVEAQVLYGMCASGNDLAPPQVRDSIVALVRAHGGLGWKALAGAFVSDPTDEEIAALARFQQASASAETAARLLEVYYNTDIRALLPAIKAPTAVLHREGDRGTRFELGREAAALITGATLIPLPGASHLFYHGDWPSVLDATVDFLTEQPERPGQPEQSGQASQLTARELEVAELVAEGLTNQAIASRLSVAPRTAEAHMENIRRKLQVRSRAQIAAWVTKLSSAPDGKDRHRIGRPAQRYLPGGRPPVPPEGPPSADDGGPAR
jgi:pimeloyl-ACP methyl ester carboxylesterase/DNA-binding CsgD family transcriptional regulator